MAKGKTKNNRAAKKSAWQKPKRANVVGPDNAEEHVDVIGEAPKTRYGVQVLARDSAASRVKRLDRLQRVRLERAVARGRERYGNYVAPPPPETEEERKRRKKGGPETWKLRGAARPWEEVEAARLADHHAGKIGVDAFALYGGQLAERVDGGAEFVESLVDLARDEASRGRCQEALDLCQEALCSDVRDLSGASFTAVDVALGFERGLDVATDFLAPFATERAVPAFARAAGLHLRRRDAEAAEALKAAAKLNGAAARAAAFPEAFDAAVECEDDLMAVDDLAPGSTLEGLVIHLHLKLIFQDRPDDRAALANVMDAAGLRRAALPTPDVAEPPTAFPHAAMFHGMFRTALGLAGCDAPPPPPAEGEASPPPPAAEENGDVPADDDDDFPEIKG